MTNLNQTPGSDNLVLPFQLEHGNARGRVVRLGATIDTILSRHNYPEPVSEVLGEAVALTGMLGVALKFQGKLILQTKSDGLIDFLVVQYEAPQNNVENDQTNQLSGGKIRAYARFDKDALAQWQEADTPDKNQLLGKGHLAMTVDQGEDMERYQGIVALEGAGLTEAANVYFRQSEQLPSFIRLAVARHFEGGDNNESGTWSWRAGGLMVQDLTSEGGKAEASRLLQGEGGNAENASGAEPASGPIMSANDLVLDESESAARREENWNRVSILAATIEDHELLDPLLAPERLLYRLFHEEGVRTYESIALGEHCPCTREQVSGILNQFSKDELLDMREDGKITITCEFCSTPYVFEVDSSEMDNSA